MEVAKVIDITPERELQQKALAIPEQAKMIVVSDRESMEIADNTINSIKSVIKEIDDWFEPIVKAAFDAHRALTAKRADTKKPLEEAARYLTTQIKSYQMEEKRRAEEEAARMREAARKAEEERLLREAEEAERSGNKEEAEAILNEEVSVPYVPPVMNVAKVDNRRYRIIPKGRITNPVALIKAIAANPALMDLVKFDQGAINRKAARLGKELNEIPGLEYYEE